MTELKQVASCVTCHAWNKDKTRVAFCPNNTEVRIFAKSGDDWVLEHTLTEHDAVVTGIDWAPDTNRIVTSSQDRNAYVWTFQNGIWKPTLVILRIARAATSVKWSPKENKFAVSSGAKCVSICYFDKDNDWWVSKHIKKHKSTVLKVDWHPNNVLIATASSDYKARVFSAFIKGIDDKPGETPFGAKLPFGGEPLAEYNVGAWIHSILWSPSGNRLAFVAHDSSITFVDLAGGAPGVVQTLRLNGLPFLDLLFLNENTVVAGGYSCSIQKFTNSGGTWSQTGEMSAQKAEKNVSSNRAAFDLFKNKVEVGQNVNVQDLDTLHQNAINNLQPFQKTGSDIKQFTSSGLDGKIVLWS
jgi:actin related protein 2/3 complex subunit 1A/1B